MYEGRMEQVGRFVDGKLVLSMEPACDRDPCAKHDRCHCSCPCMPDGEDNCADCAAAFGED